MDKANKSVTGIAFGVASLFLGFIFALVAVIVEAIIETVISVGSTFALAFTMGALGIMWFASIRTRLDQISKRLDQIENGQASKPEYICKSRNLE